METKPSVELELLKLEDLMAPLQDLIHKLESGTMTVHTSENKTASVLANLKAAETAIQSAMIAFRTN